MASGRFAGASRPFVSNPLVNDVCKVGLIARRDENEEKTTSLQQSLGQSTLTGGGGGGGGGSGGGFLAGFSPGSSAGFSGGLFSGRQPTRQQ